MYSIKSVDITGGYYRKNSDDLLNSETTIVVELADRRVDPPRFLRRPRYTRPDTSELFIAVSMDTDVRHFALGMNDARMNCTFFGIRF